MCPSLIEIGSKTAEKNCTNKQTDTTKIMVTWPWTNNVYGAVIIPNQPTWTVSLPINGWYHPHPPSPFIIITQHKSQYSFYRSTEVGRPRHCRKGVQPMTMAVHRSGCRDKQLDAASHTADHYDLQRHVDVNNLPKVVNSAVQHPLIELATVELQVQRPYH